MNDIYQTLDDRNNPDVIESEGPFKCRSNTSWLGDGYYFWDTFEELAHFWGKKSGYNNYVVCKAEADLSENICYDLFGNLKHIKEFRNIIDFMESEGLLDDKTTVKRIIEFMRKKGSFQHHAIRVFGINTISNSEDNKDFILRFKFIDHKVSHQYLDMIPAVQVCIYNCIKVSLNNYRIIYPDIYVEGYVI